MEHSKLSAHKFKKGKFITPFNEIMSSIGKNDSWCYGRYPEYLWIGLIFQKYGRKKGLNKCHLIVKKLHDINPNLSVPSFSAVLSMDKDGQEIFFKYILDNTEKDILLPLTVLFSYSEYPVFSKCFFTSQMSIAERKNLLIKVLEEGYDHQSEFATDIRFVVLFFSNLSGNLQMRKQEVDLLREYPLLEHSDEKMRMIRPMIRATELMLIDLEEHNALYLNYFWERISKMSDCKLFGMKFPEEAFETHLYTDLLHEVFGYLTGLLKSTSPLDEKMLVLLGIATYSYKRLLELANYKLFNTIAGRGIVRVLIEDYIVMKYLLQNESSQKNIWSEYQYYGIGLYKLVLARSRESKMDLSDSHVEYKYLEMLVNEYTNEEFINMDTSYFDKQNVREKANAVNEKELYGLFYDYDSSFEHGLWGAIRESSLLKCDTPAHQYHCVPDYENSQSLKSVWPDCVRVMNKTVLLLNDIYGIPANLLEAVRKFEK